MYQNAHQLMLPAIKITTSITFYTKQIFLSDVKVLYGFPESTISPIDCDEIRCNRMATLYQGILISTWPDWLYSMSVNSHIESRYSTFKAVSGWYILRMGVPILK